MESDDRSKILNDLAQAIADGEPVDWEEMFASHEGLTDSLRRLRLVDSVANVHRSPHPADPEVPPPVHLSAAVDHASGRALPIPPAPETWGPLRITEGDALGVGGFGVVYRAHDPSLGKDVALKLLKIERRADGKSAEQFLAEARRLAKVRHENVLVVHGAAEHEGRLGLWTDLVEGQTLEEVLTTQGPMSAAEAAVAGIEICRALAAVHRAGLVHRDVKTRNVMRRSGDGRNILMDFSAAAERNKWSEMFDSEARAGTPLFVAPEVLRGAEADVSADIYSLGVVLHRLVSGKFPYEARTLNVLRDKQDRGEIIRLLDERPDLPASFMRIVERALATDPGARYASAGEMERELRGFLGEEPPLPDPSRTRRRLTAILGAAAAVLFATLAGLYFFRSPASGGGFEVSAELFRRSQGLDEELKPGGLVHPGDYLFLRLETPTAANVYVVNVDGSGKSVALFPMPGSSERNPLKGGLTHRIPGKVNDEAYYWQLGGDRGPESFYVIVSKSPLLEAERLMKLAGQPRGSDGESDLGVEGAGEPERPPKPGGVSRGPDEGPYRGVESVGPAPEEQTVPSDGEVAKLLHTLLNMPGKRADVWVRRIQFQNTGS